MFINKSPDGRNNICGIKVALLRKAEGVSQRELADRLQRLGLDVDKNAVQRMSPDSVLLRILSLDIWRRRSG